MALDVRRVTTLLFDYGSTLIDFSGRQIAQLDAALADFLGRRFGPFDRERLLSLREADRMAPYRDDYHENKMPEISANLIRNLYGREPSQEELAEMLQVRFDAFLGCIEKSDGMGDVLRRFRERYRLGLVSNYPDGRAIRESLVPAGLADCFDTVVVSGDVGRVKPHPLPFTVALERLGATADTAIHVGDNWLADIQGAKRLGMQAVHCLQYQTPEKFGRRPGDHEPDLVVNQFSELEKHLL